MGTLLKTFVISAVVIVIAGFVGLSIMAGIAGSHGVKAVPVPPVSFVASNAPGAVYKDAYRAPMRYASFRSIAQVADNAFAGGKEAQRSSSEVVYTDRSRGLRRDVSFMLDTSADPPTLTVATAVRIETRFGKAYWTIARFVHRKITPYKLDRMAHSAPD